MKQFISTKQLEELSDKAKDKLRKWWKPIGNEFIYTPTFEKGERTKKWSVMQMNETWMEDWNWMKKRYEWVEDALPLLSIGQMIDFLNDQDKKRHEYWIGDVMDSSQDTPVPLYKGELCDALWKAVKEILEK